MSSFSSLLAQAYDSAIAAVAADGNATPQSRWFVAWLADHWRNGDLAPDAEPDAISVDPKGTPRMRWYLLDEAVIGFASADASGCYVIPIEELSRLSSLLASV
jgi:hypothetical protein